MLTAEERADLMLLDIYYWEISGEDIDRLARILEWQAFVERTLAEIKEKEK